MVGKPTRVRKDTVEDYDRGENYSPQQSPETKLTCQRERITTEGNDIILKRNYCIVLTFEIND